MSTPSIVIVGSNHECASVDLRERLAFNGETLAGGLRALHEHVDEGLIVSTCNRTELYVVVDGDADGRDQVHRFLNRYHNVPTHVLEQMSYTHAGPDAIRHLFRVASGLDSMVLGEPQILTQIRDALKAAREAGSAGPYLQRLATDALRVGKRARTDTDIARNRLSISHAAVELAVREVPNLAGSRVALIGAGKMAGIAARVLAAKGVTDLTIVNRSIERARPVAEQTGATVRPLADLAEVLRSSDVVIAAVLTDEPIVTPSMLEGRAAPLLLIDLGVPRVIDAACESVPNVTVRDVDALEQVASDTRSRFAGEIEKVEGLVLAAAVDYLNWTRSRAAAAAIRHVRHHADAVREVEIERALRRLGHLSERDRNVVTAMAQALTNTLMHQPVQALRAAPTPEQIACVLATFGLDPEADER